MMDLMGITAEDKKRLVEYGVKQFEIKPEFLFWLIEEFEQVYNRMLNMILKDK